jgi:hypothetical protein
VSGVLLALLCCFAWWLHFDAISCAVGTAADEEPIAAAGVMDALADQLVFDVELALAMWAGDDQLFPRFRA